MDIFKSIKFFTFKQRTGAHTIAQDEASSTVWGMPGGAKLDGAAEVLSISNIAKRLVSLVYGK